MKAIEYLIALLFALLIGSTAAKGQPLQWDRPVHDFGTLAEAEGPVQTTFTFTNVGTEPFQVNMTYKECGCTLPEVTTDTLYPGDEGTLTVTYNPLGRPGNFTKKVRVSGPGLDSTYSVTITGTVTPHPLPILSGPLRMSSTQFDFGTQYHTASASTSIALLNVADSLPLRFNLDSATLPPGFRLTAGATTLAPGQQDTLRLHWEVAESGRWGYQVEVVEIPVVLNDTLTVPLRLLITGTIKEDFSETLEAGKAPMAQLEHTSIDLGLVDSGATVFSAVRLHNKGQAPLHLRQIKTSCECLQVAGGIEAIAPGEAAMLSVRYQHPPTVRGQSQRHLVRLTVNDPEQPELSLEVVAQAAEAAPEPPVEVSKASDTE